MTPVTLHARFRRSLRRAAHRCGFAIATAATLWIGATPAAHAQDPDSDSRLMEPLMPLRLEAHGALTWDGLVAAGARADIPLIKRGALANDELAISTGADVTLASFKGSNVLTVWPTVTLQWSLGLNDHVSIYPELGIAAKVDKDGWQGVYPNVGFGGRYYLWRSVSLMARFGWPMALSVGATF